MSAFGQKLERFLLSRNAVGCNPSQVEKLSQQCSEPLPADYLQFLRVGGNGIEGFLTGVDYKYVEIDGMREAADELLVAAGLPPLSKNAFVFMMHQGYQFYFLEGGEVFYYYEGRSEIEKQFSSFEEFFDAYTTGRT